MTPPHNCTARQVATLQTAVCPSCTRHLPHPDGGTYCLFGYPPDAYRGHQPLAWTRLPNGRIKCNAFTPRARPREATAPPPAPPAPPPPGPGSAP
jgi:hypothetical protein